MRYRNSSNETRTWPWLTNADTGRTLTLAPGEDAEIDGTVDDPRLTPLRKKPTKPQTPDEPAKP